MIEPLLALPSDLRSRLKSALLSSALAPPYSAGVVRLTLGGGDRYDAEAILDALVACDQRGVSGPAVALVLDAAATAVAGVNRPDLVWSGPSAPGIHTRNTRQVYEELISAAQQTIWISTYAYWDGKHAFKSLADQMDRVPDLQVNLLVNIARPHGNTEPAEAVAVQFAARLWKYDWPGQRRPDVYYDPRALDPDGPDGVLHAKAIVVDDSATFVTSANLTEAAFDRNIEVGVLSRDALLATSLARHFRLLIDHGRLEAL